MSELKVPLAVSFCLMQLHCNYILALYQHLTDIPHSHIRLADILCIPVFAAVSQIIFVGTISSIFRLISHIRNI